jgi:hypothetical protein
MTIHAPPPPEEVTKQRFPCETCATPQGEEVRFRLGQGAFLDKDELSPSGLVPVICCRIRTVGAIREFRAAMSER